MTSPPKPGFLLPFAATLAVLLALYVGAYYAMLERIKLLSQTNPDTFDAVAPAYLLGGRQILAAKRFFAPIHWLDRHIRPHVWELTPMDKPNH